MTKSVVNKQGNFGIKILWRYIDMAIFVLRCFILTHPVHVTDLSSEVFFMEKLVCIIKEVEMKSNQV